MHSICVHLHTRVQCCKVWRPIYAIISINEVRINVWSSIHLLITKPYRPWHYSIKPHRCSIEFDHSSSECMSILTVSYFRYASVKFVNSFPKIDIILNLNHQSPTIMHCRVESSRAESSRSHRWGASTNKMRCQDSIRFDSIRFNSIQLTSVTRQHETFQTIAIAIVIVIVIVIAISISISISIAIRLEWYSIA